MPAVSLEQLEHASYDGNIYAVAPIDPLPEAGEFTKLEIFHYISATTTAEARQAIFKNRQICPVWTVDLDVLIDETDVIESVTSDILVEPTESKRKEFRVTRFLGSAVINSLKTAVHGVVGKNFSGVIEFPDIAFDVPDIPALLYAMGKLPVDSQALTEVTADMKPHEIKKVEKLRTAQEKVLMGNARDVLSALRKVIPAEHNIPETHPLIPTLEGWRSW